MIDADVLPVPDLHVMEILFPADAMETSIGKLNAIVASGVAKIVIGGFAVRGVPLCRDHTGRRSPCGKRSLTKDLSTASRR